MDTVTYLKRFERDMRIRHLSPKTITHYLNYLKFYLGYFKNQSPENLSIEDIKTFLMSLIAHGYSVSYLKGMLGSLKNFYTYTLGLEWNSTGIPMPRQSKKLPVVLYPVRLKLYTVRRSALPLLFCLFIVYRPVRPEASLF